MATKLFFLYPTSVLLILLCFSFSISLANVPQSSTSIAPEIVCKSTPYYGFCKSMFPRKTSCSIFDYFRSSAHISLSTAGKVSYMVDRIHQNRPFLSETVIRALEDCRLLAGLNVDFLSSSMEAVNSTNSLSSFQADDVQSLLSAILTNHRTCFDGLNATTLPSTVKNGLYDLLSNGTKMYSVSLALFSHGWVHEKNKAKPGNHPFSIGGRKLLQTTKGNVTVRETVVVRKDGKGNFTTINDAVAAAPNGTSISGGYFVIRVVAGVYAEYISIDKNKKNIMMIGDGINQTVITGNRSVNDGWTTFSSATLAVVGQGFVAINITIRNTAGAIKGQAVAVRNGADLSAFYKCSIEGYQDTLYTHSLRQFYRECDIYGTVDFIFGNAAVVFQKCNIYARQPIQGQSDTITAQGRSDPNQNTGTSVQKCHIKAASDLVSSNFTTLTYLGRPWRQYARTVFMQSILDSLIDPAGWLAWDSNSSTLTTIYYAEFNNTGAGSNTTSRVSWPGFHVINATDAANFTVSKFIVGDNWLPATGVPYSRGLK